MIIGPHPKFDSIEKNIKYAINNNFNAVQIFTKTPFKAVKIDRKKLDMKKLIKLIKKNNIKLYVHASYLLNLTRKSPPSKRNLWAMKSLIDDINLLNELGGEGITFHTSSPIEVDRKTGINNIYKSIKYVLNETKNIKIYIETPSKSNNIGSKIEELAKLYDKFTKGDRKRVKICIDTAHIFAMGYEINKLKGMKDYFDKFNKLIGLQNIGQIQLNDNVGKLGRNKDVHINIGKGEIWKDNKKSLKYLLTLCNNKSIPIILETKINFMDDMSVISTVMEGGGNIKEKLIKIFEQMAFIEKHLGNEFKVNAYNNAIKTIILFKDKIVTGEQFKNVNGIGKKIVIKITEIIETGKLEQLENYKKNPKVRALINISSIYGMGPVQSRKLVEQYNAFDYKDVYELYKNKVIKLTRLQKLGLKYHTELIKPVTRDDAEYILKLIKNKIDKKYKIMLLGSYRRGKEKMHDVDILIFNPKWKILSDINNFDTNKLDDDIIIKSKDKLTLFMKGKHNIIHVDILLTIPSSFAAAQLYLTGSRHFTVMMRTLAKKKKFLLNKYGLYKLKGKKRKQILIRTEKDIFKQLDVPYLSPEDRI